MTRLLRDGALVPEQEIIPVGAAYEATLGTLESHIRRLAFRLSMGDRELARDLAQEARLKLWVLDPSRYEASAAHSMVSSLGRAMLDYLRKELRISGADLLQARLDGGPDGGLDDDLDDDAHYDLDDRLNETND